MLKGVWHTVAVNEACVIFEPKDGAYTLLSIEATIDSESLEVRTKLINNLRSARRIGNILAILDIRSTINIEFYINEAEVLKLYRLAMNQTFEQMRMV